MLLLSILNPDASLRHALGSRHFPTASYFCATVWQRRVAFTDRWWCDSLQVPERAVLLQCPGHILRPLHPDWVLAQASRERGMKQELLQRPSPGTASVLLKMLWQSLHSFCSERWYKTLRGETRRFLFYNTQAGWDWVTNQTRRVVKAEICSWWNCHVRLRYYNNKKLFQTMNRFFFSLWHHCTRSRTAEDVLQLVFFYHKAALLCLINKTTKNKGALGGEQWRRFPLYGFRV